MEIQYTSYTGKNTRSTERYLGCRRFIELAVILLFSPILLLLVILLSVLILVCDGRPIFFYQLRPGKNGRLFTLYKFRTMRQGTDSIRLTISGDKRITRCGKFLRKLKLDELPQVYNIIKGEMS